MESNRIERNQVRTTLYSECISVYIVNKLITNVNSHISNKNYQEILPFFIYNYIINIIEKIYEYLHITKQNTYQDIEINLLPPSTSKRDSYMTNKNSFIYENPIKIHEKPKVFHGFDVKKEEETLKFKSNSVKSLWEVFYLNDEKEEKNEDDYNYEIKLLREMKNMSQFGNLTKKEKEKEMKKEFNSSFRKMNQIDKSITHDYEGRRIYITGVKYNEDRDDNKKKNISSNKVNQSKNKEETTEKDKEKDYNDMEININNYIKVNSTVKNQEVQKNKETDNNIRKINSIFKENKRKNFLIRSESVVNSIFTKFHIRNNKDLTDILNHQPYNKQVLGSIFNSINPSVGVKYIENQLMKENIEKQLKVEGKMSIDEYNLLKKMNKIEKTTKNKEKTDENTCIFKKNQSNPKEKEKKEGKSERIVLKSNGKENLYTKISKADFRNEFKLSNLLQTNKESEKFKRYDIRNEDNHIKLISSIIMNKNWGYGNLEGRRIINQGKSYGKGEGSFHSKSMIK